MLLHSDSLQIINEVFSESDRLPFKDKTRNQREF